MAEVPPGSLHILFRDIGRPLSLPSVFVALHRLLVGKGHIQDFVVHVFAPFLWPLTKHRHTLVDRSHSILSSHLPWHG